jgi:Zn ribbon nucleic-acid-binding protein
MARPEPAACPHCESRDTVQTGQTLLMTLHLCFTCGKAFERKVPRMADGSHNADRIMT